MKRHLSLALLITLLLAFSLPAEKKSDKKKDQAAAEETSPQGLYKYLPESYDKQAVFTVADLIALKMTAYNSRAQGISGKLISSSITALAWPDSLVLNCYLELQEKDKASYLGAGKFTYPQDDLPAMFQEAVTFIQKMSHLYYADLNDKYTVINLYMKGSLVANWKDFQLKVQAQGK
ncbi:MAG: hypothetical protein A2509_02990 [Candidatus Edwardsbacteria bacterium RIFOXYD12_FULL_50_11]|uniref:Uncharacterized protein n=1 Tax=Candidatus Edwardsbacteria bacterium GWF2_54_11 TaxID=1817851 RepID=A0A1F5RI80_9BACT|nr:MAG: hypothetical protein A2502_06855 [Candidatus Edwardsbacteria bacterium RifOxyC12_full_54_24]OGF06985.1 MAG: hypothetical protein A2273_08575 [Candidatus Edwardsbacteria bacterium RifOxyA12_full_54_48]OGF11049.1 MAG: hypothetical protein A3K15_07935 [Candidatus Edwardsbacteria bacterium GWE2_54_12]OGF14052.1 MAG: hypothetical protein A2024_05830 [Candidatus Edwardsbacteria bacterium GWF2_54_11]OGF15995.1 MAG: hypothetical protein A2509_02990 [Candidatus Edwardsbacteria bacterium RIFOXYD1